MTKSVMFGSTTRNSYLFDEILLSVLYFQNLRFDSILSNELIDMNRFSLSDTVNTVHSLTFDSFL